ncbi:MAG: hypothetical protein RRX93_03600 [Bacteroidales bacterium]
MKKFTYIAFLMLVFLIAATFASVQGQSSYIDLTIVESSDYNKALATFSHESFQDAFKVASATGERFEPNLSKALVLFIGLLKPERSYIIQHEPTYYFVFQYNQKNANYLVMNNSIGEKNEAIYVKTFAEAQKEMLSLLQVFYSNTPVFSVTEYK